MILSTVEPNEVAKLAMAHQVGPLLSHRLSSFRGHEQAEKILVLLKLEVRLNALRTLSNIREQWALLRAFEASDIRVVPLKGVGLGKMLYGDPSLRQQGDIDLWIPDDKVPAAYTLMRKLGFEDLTRYGELSESAKVWVRRSHKDIEWIRRAPPCLRVDLHWRPTRQLHLMSMPFWDVWNRSDELALGSCKQLVFSAEDLLIYLCVHGSATAWFRCKWIADLPPLIHRETLDWNLIHQRAVASGSVRAVAIGLAAARDLFCVHLPPGALKIAQRASMFDRQFVVEALMSPDDWWPGSRLNRKPWRFQLRYWKYQWRLGDSWRYRREYLASRFISLDDLRVMRMPGVPLWVYAVIRPFSWAFRLLHKACSP